jgi:hypothetical protein
VHRPWMMGIVMGLILLLWCLLSMSLFGLAKSFV